MHTVKSTVTLQPNTKFQTKAESREFSILMDEPEIFGGENTAMNPLELLLSALGGCITISLKAFAKEVGVELNGASVDIEGDFDPAGFMGKDENIRPGYQNIRCKVKIDSPSDPQKIEQLLQLVEKRCPVSDTLKGVTVKIEL